PPVAGREGRRSNAAQSALARSRAGAGGSSRDPSRSWPRAQAGSGHRTRRRRRRPPHLLAGGRCAHGTIGIALGVLQHLTKLAHGDPVEAGAIGLVSRLNSDDLGKERFRVVLVREIDGVAAGGNDIPERLKREGCLSDALGATDQRKLTATQTPAEIGVEGVEPRRIDRWCGGTPEHQGGVGSLDCLPQGLQLSHVPPGSRNVADSRPCFPVISARLFITGDSEAATKLSATVRFRINLL